MKRIICLSLAALMLMSVLTGCSKAEAPDASEATTTEATLNTVASTSSSVPSSLSDYQIPDRFSGSWTGLEDTFFVNADAEILFPDTENLFTANVERRAFTQEEADKMLEVFMRGNTLYENPVTTKQDYEKIIARWEAMLSGEIPYEGDGTIERLPELIAQAKENMDTAPDEGEVSLAGTVFHSADVPNSQIIEGYANVDGQDIFCCIYNSDGTQMDYARFWNGSYGDANGIFFATVNENGEKISPEFTEIEAQNMSDRLMKNLGLDMFICDRIEALEYMDEDESGAWQFNGETGYRMDYVRQINGLSLTKTNFSGGATADEMAGFGTWAYERIEVYVTKDNVVWFSWSNPYITPQIIEENVSIIPFSDVQDVFEKMIFVKNHYLLEANKVNGFDTIRNLDVDRVQLTLMRVRDEKSMSDGTIIPVWDFWGTTIACAADSQHTDLVSNDAHYGVVLSINAIDGTIVDRELGY